MAYMFVFFLLFFNWSISFRIETYFATKIVRACFFRATQVGMRATNKYDKLRAYYMITRIGEYASSVRHWFDRWIYIDKSIW